MRLSLLCLALVTLLNACGGGSSSSTSSATSSSADLSKGLELSAGPASGNGIWNYSVATDIYYGTMQKDSGQQKGPSLYSDILKYDPQHTAIKYVFPVFGNIQSGTDNNFTAALSSGVCPKGISKAIPIFSYYALPQVQDKLSTGENPTVPGKPFSITLGLCADGQAVTNYYKNIVGIPYVVPVVELPDFSIYIGTPSSAEVAARKSGGTAPSLNPTQILAIADEISKLIVNDKNAYGVAFDNELAINKATSPLAKPTVNCAGLYYEALFYGRIAQNLAAASKYLFLFDAPDTGNTLYQGLKTITDPTDSSKTCPSSLAPDLPYGALTNIILQKPLYDMTVIADGTSNGPISVQDNTTQAQKSIASYLGTQNGPPVTFVLPASATSTMWESLQIYNISGFNNALKNPVAPPVLPTKILPLSQADTCNQDATDTSTINYQVLSQYLCIPSSDGKSCLVPTAPSAITALIGSFINLPNCGSFANGNVKMQQYFAGETSLITSMSTSNKSQAYLGSSLYAWRISAMSDLSAAHSANSLLGNATPVSYSVQLFPMNITDGVWANFISWAEGFPK